MGLWSFVKDAGKSLLGGKAEAATAPDAETLKQEVKDLGLDASGVDIAVEGDKVVVTGAAVSPEVKEKIILAVGNVAGVAAVQADTTEEPVFHTVAKGDTLSAIAKQFYGDANTYPKIFEANREVIKDANLIFPGQKIRIPKA